MRATFTTAALSEAVRLVNDGAKVAAVAKLTGVPPSTIYKHAGFRERHHAKKSRVKAIPVKASPVRPSAPLRLHIERVGFGARLVACRGAERVTVLGTQRAGGWDFSVAGAAKQASLPAVLGAVIQRQATREEENRKRREAIEAGNAIVADARPPSSFVRRFDKVTP